MLSLPSALPQSALQADEGTRSQQLQAQLATRSQSGTDKAQETRKAATELGSLFVSQVLQAMRRTVPKSGLLDQGFAQETYVSMFDQEIARHIAQREDLGLQALLQRQLRTASAGDQPPAAGTPDSTPLPRRGPERLATVSGLARGTAVAAYRQQESPGESAFILPLAGRQTSGFGRRMHPIHQEERLHHGVDLAAPPGTPIQAAADGQVVFSGTQAGYGNVVILQHAQGYTTRYAHNAENLVAVGSSVRQGQPIATVGQTGDATGPHVHFEIRRHNQPLDPMAILAPGGNQKKTG
ncbi:MAG: peptidoglycan DD-metalloendopeptidase family protein [Candidatus Tectimicrobiota bacterium]